MAHSHDAYDHIGLTTNSTYKDCQAEYFFDYKDPFISFLPSKILSGIGCIILAIGVVLRIKHIKLNQNKLIICTFILNILLHCPSLYRVNNRQGVDYNAYINQAGCLAGGDTRYWKISSLQGPCFYPAGHIWFYLPAYFLHIYTENAEYIIKFGFFVIHSLSISLVSKISCAYFKDEPERAQLITFMLLANENDRVFN